MILKCELDKLPKKIYDERINEFMIVKWANVNPTWGVHWPLRCITKNGYVIIEGVLERPCTLSMNVTYPNAEDMKHIVYDPRR